MSVRVGCWGDRGRAWGQEEVGTQGSVLSLGFAGGPWAPGLAVCLPHIS